MSNASQAGGLAPPRIIALGSYRDALGLSGDGIFGALGRLADVRHVDTTGPLWGSPHLLTRAMRAAREHGAELVHVFDARYAAVGRWVGNRYGIPATLSLSSADIPVSRGWPRPTAAVGRYDLAFVSEPAVAAALRERAPSLDVMVCPPVARPLPWPASKDMSSITRLLRDVRPGRLVVGVPWPADRRDVRWFRDAIAPMLDGGPMCLIFAASNRRDARLLFGAQGMQRDFRVHTGRLDGATLAAVARCVDTFAVPSGVHGLRSGASDDMAVALAMGGVPVVTYGEQETRVLAHEQNAFVVEPDERAFIYTLNQVLSLPAVQRQALGEDFARYTLRRWPWEAVSAIYADRFAALVGRPAIPVDLRAA
jgi:glycosyltransferase involved in cell wall biosynthesis